MTPAVRELAMELLRTTMSLIPAGSAPGQKFKNVLVERGRDNPHVLQAALEALDRSGYTPEEFLAAHWNDVNTAVQQAIIFLHSHQ